MRAWAMAGLVLAAVMTPALAAEDAGTKIMRETYPPESLKLGEEGTVGLAMDVDSGGKIVACQATRSSGYARLDRAACDLMLVHVARIPPLPGAKRGPAVRMGQIDWELPAGFARPATPPPHSSEVALKEAAEKVTCVFTAREGSLQMKKMVCLTAADRRRSNEYTRANQGVY